MITQDDLSMIDDQESLVQALQLAFPDNRLILTMHQMYQSAFDECRLDMSFAVVFGGSGVDLASYDFSLYTLALVKFQNLVDDNSRVERSVSGETWVSKGRQTQELVLSFLVSKKRKKKVQPAWMLDPTIMYYQVKESFL